MTAFEFLTNGDSLIFAYDPSGNRIMKTDFQDSLHIHTSIRQIPDSVNAFGMVMPERSFSNDKYRYGFNGKETDRETQWQDYGFRIYYPGLCKFVSVDPLTKDYPYYTPYQFAGNTPVQAIDLDGGEPKSIIAFDPVSGFYKFTNPAIEVLSLVSGVSKKDLKNANIRQRAHFPGIHAIKGVPWYKAKEGGGGVTIGEKITLTENYFDDGTEFGSAGFGQNAYEWMELMSHEVIHLDHMNEVGEQQTDGTYKVGDKIKYVTSFISGYAKNAGHDGEPREKEADVGTEVFIDFNKFARKFDRKESVIDILENKKLHRNDEQKVKEIRRIWNAYQSSKDGFDVNTTRKNKRKE